jgi:hypothetical protein
MSGLTKAAQDNLLNLMKGTAWPAGTGGWGVTPPTTNTYVGLFTTNPTTDATVSYTGTEVTGGSYARVAVANASGWSAISTVGSLSQISNAGIITFPTPTVSWGTIIGVGLFDAVTTGNLLWWSSITSQVIGIGVVASFAIGALVFQVD